MTQEEAKELKKALLEGFRKNATWLEGSSDSTTAIAHAARAIVELEKFAWEQGIKLD